jgi:hypothetical protein
MPFLDSDTCAGGGRGLFISARVFFLVWCHPWMDDGTDGWMEKASRPRRPLLYVTMMKLFGTLLTMNKNSGEKLQNRSSTCRNFSVYLEGKLWSTIHACSINKWWGHLKETEITQFTHHLFSHASQWVSQGVNIY